MADEIFPYQEEGAEWLLKHDRAGLHDEAGLGKTFTTIRALDKGGLRRGLIIARAMLRQEWMREHEQRAEMPRRMIKGLKPRDFVAWERGQFDVLLLSYEMAAKWAIHFAGLGEIIDFAVIDEAHFLRNPGANRTKMILGADCHGGGGIIQWARYSWHLTGTSMVKDPMDVYTFLRFAGVTNLGRYEFRQTYFIENNGGGPARVKASKVAELQAMYQQAALRRTLATVGVQLPDIFYSQMRIEGDDKDVAKYLRDHPGLDECILDALERGNIALIQDGHMMRLRRLIGEAKAVPFAVYLVEALQSGELDKVVVMGCHRAALETIHAKLRQAGLKGFLVNGGTSENARVVAREEFQTDPTARYFIGNSGTAGTGITLHAACHLFVFESEWNPGDNEQMIKRIRRIGQKRQQHARFVTLAGSLDEEIQKLIVDKTREIARAQGKDLLTLPHAA